MCLLISAIVLEMVKWSICFLDQNAGHFVLAGPEI